MSRAVSDQEYWELRCEALEREHAVLIEAGKRWAYEQTCADPETPWEEVAREAIGVCNGEDCGQVALVEALLRAEGLRVPTFEEGAEEESETMDEKIKQGKVYFTEDFDEHISLAGTYDAVAHWNALSGEEAT